MNTGIIIIINDNNQSVPENYGALSAHLNKLYENAGLVENNFFEALGFEYFFVKNGNSVEDIVRVLDKVKGTTRPTIVHCRTEKAKGYEPARQDLENWHWANPFKIDNGIKKNKRRDENYGSIVSRFLIDKIHEKKDLIVIAASTPVCIGFNEDIRKKAGKQYIDVGIAEQNAVTMAAGIAKMGGAPIVATNSTFFQRCYDQIEQEVGINSLPVTFLITHASIYGHTTDTHAGIYDISLFSSIPNLLMLSPTTKEEYLNMLEWSIDQREVPVAIRIPWQGVVHDSAYVEEKEYLNIKYKVLKRGEKVAIIALGASLETANKVYKLLTHEGVNPTIINPRYANRLDYGTLDSISENHELVVTIEDGIKNGGFGSLIAQYYGTTNIKVLVKGFSNNLPRRFRIDEILLRDRMSAELITEDILQIIRHE